jgi:hypothetical protein
LKESFKRLGIVGPRHYRHLVEELRKAQVRTGKLAQALDAARSDARESKARADKALRDAKERMKAEFERKYEQARRKITETEQQRAAVVGRLTQQLAGAERDLVAARESLMAVEVKLDILEGAANVLDARTRGAGARSAPAGSAPV